MERTLAIVLLHSILLFWTFGSQPASEGQPVLIVDEAATRIQFEEGGTAVELALENRSQQPVRARIVLEVLDPRGQSLARIERESEIQPGSVRLPIRLSLSISETNRQNNLKWFRLSYQVSAAGTVATDGFISFSRAAHDLFELRLSKPAILRPGAAVPVAVRAFHPSTGNSAEGVRLNLELGGSGATAVTDAQGYAEALLVAPAMGREMPKLMVFGTRRGLVRQIASAIVQVVSPIRTALHTDKPLYQPGQVLHARAQVSDFQAQALSGTRGSFRVTDPEGRLVFQQEVVTSRFGIANADWTIPNDVPLGDYWVRLDLDSGPGQHSGPIGVRISRYELPTFRIRVTPDRSFYFSGQEARIEVSSEFLFGQPVGGGRVRVARQIDRRWNYKTQKWQVSEGRAYESVLDGKGRASLVIDLQSERTDLSARGHHFEDIQFIASVVDPASGRTQHEYFALRATHSPIHIYTPALTGILGPADSLSFYLSTFYPDGAPARCAISIYQVDNPTPRASQSEAEKGRLIGTVRTNRYGLAHVQDLRFTTPKGSNVDLRFEAHDRFGSIGRHAQQFRRMSNVPFGLKTDKILYRRGEPIRLGITSNGPAATAVVYWGTPERPIGIRTVALKHGQAEITLPYTKEFRGPMTITTYGLNDADVRPNRRTVLYPDSQPFKLHVQLGQRSYRPGGEARVDFALSDSTANPLGGALGIVAYDVALEERVRASGEFQYRRPVFGFQRQEYSEEIAGISLADLEGVDLSRPVADDFKLLAEVLLQKSGYSNFVYFDGSVQARPYEAFREINGRQLEPVRSLLVRFHADQHSLPKDSETLARLLAESQLRLDRLKDPWGTPYRAVFQVQGRLDAVQITSAGPDKRFDTDDDFPALRVAQPYFERIGGAINRAGAGYHERTGGFIRDLETLRSELRVIGFDLDKLQDRWGAPYRFNFSVRGTHSVIDVLSAGPDGRFDEPGVYPRDDVHLWISRVDYFVRMRDRIDRVLKEAFHKSGQFPSNQDAFYGVLRQAGIQPDELRDPWDRPFYLNFSVESSYGERVTIRKYAASKDGSQARTEVLPVSREINELTLRSAGPDRMEGTRDDFTIAIFTQVRSEQFRPSDRAATPVPSTVLTGNAGVIAGTATDRRGRRISGVVVEARRAGTAEIYRATTSVLGYYLLGNHYLLRNLPAGFYEVKASLPGFVSAIFTEVPVTVSSVTRLDFEMDWGEPKENLLLRAGGYFSEERSELADSPMGMGGGVMGGQQPSMAPISTPRLREYFPETLLWQPELLTDERGRASIKFKMPDNITTWKVSAIGSTRDGRVATAETSIRAFQPFFVEFDPPKILTQGDELKLPVVVRNYLDDPQKVDLTIRPDSWFELPDGERLSTTVEAQQATRTTFRLRTLRAVDEGKQRVTAQSAKAGDAVEKTVAVRPNGREVVETSLVLLPESRRFDLQIPATAISDSISARLKIYPNLWAHLADSIDGIMQRPYGCAEQIVSSGYASLVALRAASSPDTEFSAKARRYVQAAYDQLPAYQVVTGGFGYWGASAPDFALTAHVLKFLHGAQKVITVDDELIERARTWIFSQQQADGSWPSRLDAEEIRNRRTVLVTAYVARVVAPIASTPVEKNSLQRALAYLSGRIEEVDEPYVIACYALAALDAGQKDESRRALERLAGLARIEGATRYWMLETNSPFYGWGTAGRVETTALVVEALARGAELVPSLRQLTEQGLLFLMRNKDRHGVWHSTQATVNVLNAIVSVLAQQRVGKLGGRIEVLVDGRSVSSLQLPATEQLAVPLAVDLSRFLSQGAHAIELRGADTTAIGQLVSSWYVPWSEAAANAEGQGSLRLEVEFDRASAKVQDAIECRVRAERVGFRGYGMMLAEIGLPPGVEVDRGTLDDAVKASGWELHRYDVLPDRVVAYLWPRDGVTTFSFKFRARMGLKAQNAPSLLYDYYNPDARVVVRPQVFQIVE